ncbi:T9SS type A sorting domain-containing protein [Soonwooa sp.]|uniref:T9SS type A sorting domain-containing protein n=1 Tax=Soonwooa sp. TaxID=1938592 RepID=UPI0028AD2A0C|nr:T9SS type A sorting domain-containing protein [Soonwooa sp.]
MKKIFTILAVAAVSLVSAQTNLFAGSDFNDWAAFQSSLGFDLKSGEQSATGGIGGSGALKITDNAATSNIYVMTANKNMNVAGANFITLKVKGNAGGVSFNAGDGTAAGSKYFNVPAGTTGDVTLTGTGANSYTGSINASDWITIKLDLTGVNWGSTPSFSIKLQKSSTNALFVDDIKTDKNLAVGDVNASKVNLVKNTVVANELIFGQAANVSVINMAGQVVKTAEVKENTKLDVSNLAKGTYVVTATVNGQAVSQKVIKK